MITCSVPSTNLLNFDHMTASKLLMPLHENRLLQIALVGCGGTGSWLAPHLARLARLLSETREVEVDLVFIDPDVVEEKNIYRQNFCQAEVGCTKALSLASRYSFAWGVEIRAKQEKISFSALARGGAPGTRVIVGCVDNGEARRNIVEIMDSKTWWLDCGNHHSAGQVLLGCGARNKEDAFRLPGFCGWLPRPDVQHPELVEDLFPAPSLKGVGETNPSPFLRGGENLSCAEAALAGVQGLTVNAMVAGVAADYLYRMLITKDLDRFATYIDLVSGSMRSRYITKQEVLR